MKILKQLTDRGHAAYYDEEFRALIEAHLPYIRNDSRTHEIVVDLAKTAVYRGDFYGFLTQVGISPEFHWVIMRLNRMNTPMQFDSSITTLLIPDESQIRMIEMQYRTTGYIR